MRERSASHGTVSVEGLVNASKAQVYTAYSDPSAREAWGAPSDTAVFYYEEADFRVGGRDIARCGPKHDPRFIVETRYIEISPERSIVWTEIVREEDQTLAVNITTMELIADNDRTRVVVTVQVTSFVGEGMIANTHAGHTGSLENMTRYFDRLGTHLG